MEIVKSLESSSSSSSYEFHDNYRFKSRLPYRSVAFGTWKVGYARQLYDYERNRHKTESYSSNCDSFTSKISKTYASESNEMSHISVNLNGRSTSNETIDGTLQSECQNVPFSSSTKSESETLNLKRNFKENCSLHRISFNWRKKEKFDTSLLRAHQRSRSADGENIYSIKFSCTSPLLRGETQWLSKNAQANNSSINALKATKNFFKRLYNSATLPVRSNKPVISKALVDSSVNGPQFEIRNSSNVNNEEEEQRYCEYEVNQDSTTCITTDNESISSTIKDIADEPMNDSVFRKSFNSTCSSNFSADFHSWSEFFDHLRKEIANMRERDAQILADLRRVEIQLENVKNRAMCSSKSNYELDRRKPKLGDLVESMPL